MDGTRASPTPPAPAHALVPGAVGAVAPPLRLARFDPPPPDAAAANLTHTLDHVLDDVEHVSDGIDAMLRSASNSTLGPVFNDANPADSSADGVATIAGDDDMLRIFDDQHIADLKTIDRLLAQQAEQALDGAFESIDDLLASPGMHGIGAVIAPRPSPAANAAATPPASPTTLPRAEPADVSPLPSLPAIPLVPPPPLPPVAAVLAVLDTPAQSAAGAGPATIENGMQAPTSAWESQAPPVARLADGVSSIGHSSDAPHATPETAGNAMSTPAASRSRLSAWLMLPVTLLSGPMRLVPDSLRSAVNVLALSLALWSPLVWFGAPRLADYRRARAHAAIMAPAHGQSTLKSDDGGGHGAKPADDHTAKPGKNSGKKANAKAPSGH